eukprot:610372-Rhodomonas_salina.1
MGTEVAWNQPRLMLLHPAVLSTLQHQSGLISSYLCSHFPGWSVKSTAGCESIGDAVHCKTQTESKEAQATQVA